MEIFIFSQKPSITTEFKANLLLNERVQPILSNSVKALVDAVKQIPKLAHLSPKLQRLSTCVIDKVNNAAERNPNDFNVIIHGDMWSNNIMFSHDSVTGSATDAILVDFQIGYYGSPVLDIVYTFFTSSSDTLGANDWDKLVIHYHTELVRLLRLLGYSKPVPTLLELQADRLKRSHYSATLGMYTLAIRNLDTVEDDESSKFFSQSEDDHKYRVQMMLNPNIRKSLKFLLQFCDDNGLLDETC